MTNEVECLDDVIVEGYNLIIVKNIIKLLNGKYEIWRYV